MKVLLLSPLWSGLKSFFTEGKYECTGMPAFYEFLLALLKKEELDQIFLILLVEDLDKNEISLPPNLTRYLKVYPVVKRKGVMALFTLFRIVWAFLRIISSNSISIYFGFGSVSWITSLFVLIKKAPHQRRLFGISAVFEDLNKSKLLIFLKHPYNFLAINLYCNKLFITNDGSHGDLIFKKIGNLNTEFNFFYNGLNVVPDVSGVWKYVSFIGRIYPWKGQIYLVKALAHIKSTYHVELPAIIVGQIGDEKYLKKLEKIKNDHGLVDLKIEEHRTRENIYKLLAESKVSCSFYQTSNFGNVLIESLGLGTPVLTMNVNNSLGSIPVSALSLVSSYNAEEIGEKLYTLYNNSEMLNNISEAALAFSNKNFLNWEVRIRKEMLIIDEANER